MWAAQFIKYEKPNTWLNSGGLGTMGYGLPAAISAKIAYSDRIVVEFVEGAVRRREDVPRPDLRDRAVALDHHRRREQFLPTVLVAPFTALLTRCRLVPLLEG